jgi:glutaredoxin
MLTEDKLKQLIKETSLLLFVIPSCPWCKKAKALLKPYQPRIIVIKPEERSFLNKLSGMRTVPQIFYKGKLIGGYTDTYQYLTSRAV